MPMIKKFCYQIVWYVFIMYKSAKTELKLAVLGQFQEYLGLQLSQNIELKS